MNKETFKAYVVYYKRDGERKAKLVPTRDAARRMRNALHWNKRKFLGYRPVKLAEVV